jgi:hypothetical protein
MASIRLKDMADMANSAFDGLPEGAHYALSDCFSCQDMKYY